MWAASLAKQGPGPGLLSGLMESLASSKSPGSLGHAPSGTTASSGSLGHPPLGTTTSSGSLGHPPPSQAPRPLLACAPCIRHGSHCCQPSAPGRHDGSCLVSFSPLHGQPRLALAFL